MQYLWNSFTSFFYCVDVDVSQGFALYLSSIFHIFEKRFKNLNIPVSFLLFVDDELLISQEKSFEKFNTFLFCSYNIISSLLEQFSLTIEYRKSEIFHFSKLQGLFNSSSLDLSPLRGPILYHKDI